MQKFCLLLLGTLLLCLSACGDKKGKEPTPPTLKDFVLSTTAVQVQEGASKTLNITQGNGQYAVQSGDAAIATAEIAAEVITIKGVKPGSCVITATDVKAKKDIAIQVQVTTLPEISADVTSVALASGETKSFTLSGGSGEWEVSVSPDGVVTVTIQGNIVQVKAIGSGKAVITIKDKKSGKTLSIPVEAAAPIADVAVDKDAVSLDKGKTATVNITAGSGTYEVMSDHPEVATATLKGTVITLTAQSPGTAVVTVSDTQTNKKATIQVTVKEAATPDIALDKTSVSINQGQNANVKVVAGSGDYSAAVDKPSCATASVAEGVVTIKAIAKGSAVVTVTDNKTKKTATIQVTVSDAGTSIPIVIGEELTSRRE